MSKFKFICIFLSCLALTGCATKIEPFSFEKYNAKQKGVVFFSIAESYYDYWTGKWEDTTVPSFTIKKLGDKTETEYLVGSDLFSNGPNYTKSHMLFLDPGVYYVEKISLMSNGMAHRFYEGPGIKNGRIVYGGFIVKEGESINAGTLIVPTFKFVKDPRVKQQLESSEYRTLKLRHPILIEGGVQVSSLSKF